MKPSLRACALSLLVAALPAAAAAPTPGQSALRDIFKELVETNTALSTGSCTLAAERMAARLKRAGMPEHDIHQIGRAHV